MNKLVEFWRKFDFQDDNLVHPADREPIKYLVERAERNKREIFRNYSFKDAISAREFRSDRDTRLQLSLFPAPFTGNLDTAKIFMLLLNPGYGESDHFAESNADWRQACINTIKQEFNEDQVPFHALDPQFCWTGAFQWWEEKFRPIARVIAEDEKFNGDYGNALRFLGRHVAAIELFPYHSKKFGGAPYLSKKTALPSVVAAREFALDVLLPRAKTGDVIVYGARSVREWALGKEADVGYFPNVGKGARFVRMTAKSGVGKAILQKLSFNLP